MAIIENCIGFLSDSGRLGESVLQEAVKLCGNVLEKISGKGRKGEGKRPQAALPKGYKRVGGEDSSSLSGLICGKGNIAEAHPDLATKYLCFLFLFEKKTQLDK